MLNRLLDKINFGVYHLYAHEDDCCSIMRKVTDLGVKEVKIFLLKPTERVMVLRFVTNVDTWRTIRNELEVFRVFEEREVPMDIDAGCIYTVD